jgi:hypothetical protein
MNCTYFADSGARLSRFRSYPDQHSEIDLITIPG